MLFKSFLLLLVIGSALALMPMESKIPAGRTLMDIMLQPNTMNFESTESCFDYYIPILNGLSESYDNDLIECKKNSTNDIEVNICIRNAEAVYIANSSLVYGNLASCLEGNGMQ